MARTPNPNPPPLANGEDKKDDDALLIADDVGAEGGAAVVDDKTPAVTESVDTLKEQLAEERRKREAAEAKASSVEANANKQVADSHTRVVDSAIGKAETDKQALMQRLKDAKEQGDYDAEIKATDELQTLNYNLGRLREGKMELQRRAEERAAQPDTSGDPVVDYTRGMSPRSAKWIKDHPDFVTEANKNKQMLAAHNLAVLKDYVPDSEAYFEFIETQLGLREAAAAVEDEDVRPARAETQPPAAPVSRRSTDGNGGAGGGGGDGLRRAGITKGGDGRYHLSPQAREAAAIAGMSPEDYVKNAIQLEKEGAFVTH